MFCSVLVSWCIYINKFDHVVICYYRLVNCDINVWSETHLFFGFVIAFFLFNRPINKLAVREQHQVFRFITVGLILRLKYCCYPIVYPVPIAIDKLLTRCYRCSESAALFWVDKFITPLQDAILCTETV